MSQYFDCDSNARQFQPVRSGRSSDGPRYRTLNEEMVAAGIRTFVGGLTPAREATSLRAQPDGKVLTTEGPYLETKEHIGRLLGARSR